MDETVRLPETWNGWEIEERIGSGSYGDVYQAEYRGADPSVTVRTAAVKIIRIPSGKAEAAALAHEIPDTGDRNRYYENVVDGLCAEIRAMKTLRNNPNVVHLQDYCVEHAEGTMQWTIYIRMERLTPFPKYLITHQMTEREILRLGLSVCNVLEECEAHGILHRDIKPENIMVSDEGMYKLGDFGVARQMDLTTGSLSLKGTFTYMAPEVYHGEKYDAKADQYSLGIVLYRLLNRNRDPFVDPEARMVYYKDRESALQKRMKGEALPEPTGASENTAKVVLKACAFRKEDRYARIADLKEDLMICMGLKDGKIADKKEEAKPAVRESGNRKKFMLPVIACAAAAVVMIVLAVLGVFGGGGQEQSGSAEDAVKSSPVSSPENTSSENTDEQTSTAPAAEEPASDTKEPAEETMEPVSESGTCGDDLIWEIRGDTLTIRGTGTMEKYNIIGKPAPWSNLEFIRIVVEEGVTGISDYAFYECRQVTEIQLPDSLISIGNVATNFYHLKRISIPKNVNRIGTGFLTLSSELASITVDGENAFFDSRQDCNAIIETATNTLINGCQNTVIPDTVTAIGPGAFQSCYYLKKIYIPDSVVLIDSTAFEGREGDLTICGSASSEAEHFAEEYGFTFEETEESDRNAYAEENTQTGMCGDNLYWEVKGGTLRIWGTGDMEDYPAGDMYNSYTPWGDLTFQSVILEEGVTGISDYAFDLKMLITSVELPESLMRIGKGAFNACDIPSVTIPKNVSEIGRLAFDPSSLRFIKVDPDNHYYDSRNNCNAVIETKTNKMIIGCRNTVFPDTVTEIDVLAFSDCYELKEITIPKNVETVGAAAFSGCFQLDSLTVEKENSRYDSRNNCNAVIETKTNKLVSGCRNTVIPDSVTSIASYAFCYCWTTAATGEEPWEITIPDSVVSIEENAFVGLTEEFVICGSAGSAAEKYADENNITFKEI